MLPYYIFQMKNGNKLKFLIDIGYNKNYVKPIYIRNPIKNKLPFYVNSVGGKVLITHHTFIDIFNCGVEKQKFYSLSNLGPFDDIIDNGTLKNISAVIYTEGSYFTLLNRV